MNWYDDVILPKVWFEVIRRWWDVTVPKDYPKTTGIEFSLDFGENKDAVSAMEESLKGDDPIITPYVPENTFVQEYTGVFEAEGEPGEQILLSPVKVNADKAIALHYNTETTNWDAVDNVNVVNGYVYGDLTTLSPIAVFTLKDDIELVEGLEGLNIVACKGNPTKVYTEEDKIIAENASSKTKIDITAITPIFIIGGTYDGSDVETTSVAVSGVTHDKLRVYCGSVGTDDKVPYVGLAKAYVENSTIDGVSGSYYKAHTNKVEITIKDSHIKNHIGGGQSMYHGTKNKDGNSYPVEKELNNSADWVTNEVEINMENVKTLIFYCGGTSGRTYVKKATAVGKNCDFGWTCCGGSNGLTDDGKLRLDDSKCQVISTANRGELKSASVVLNNVEAIDGIYVCGENDSSVNGIVDEVRYDIGKGCSGKLLLGLNGGVELKDNANVKFVKYSRNAEIEISDQVKDILDEKLKMK